MEKQILHETLEQYAGQEAVPAQKSTGFWKDEEKLRKLSEILEDCEITVFEYFPMEDKILLYSRTLEAASEIPHFLDTVKGTFHIHPEDRWKALEFFKGNLRGALELRVEEEPGSWRTKKLKLYTMGSTLPQTCLMGSIRDISSDQKRQWDLEEKAKRDSLTKLYNQYTGKELIDEYLSEKNPYASCGLMVVDVDYFKSVNDNYGHLFGDEVLIRLARMLEELFDEKDLIMRAGGDEFVAFLKDIQLPALQKKAELLTQAVRRLTFSEAAYSMSCSVGVCYVPENAPGYTYEQLFSNADWALYQAKEKGRNRYVLCDTVKNFEVEERQACGRPDIDARYLQNDIIATAFEIFEKQSSFQAAIELLLEVIGVRFQLDRITVIKTLTREKETSRQYQWVSPNAPEVLETPASFTKEDFLTLFHSYDEYGTTVLDHDHMDMYSQGAQSLLMQGGAKTVVYAAMYCEGQYTGAISYVVCQNKRYWSRAQRSQFGELTKIISAHLARNQALNARNQSVVEYQDFDSLTGLLSFARFREEVERLIVGSYAQSHVMAYTDFRGFKQFNQKYGYGAGDQLLRDFAFHVAEYLLDYSEAYFTRVSADQFVLFLRYTDKKNLIDEADAVNRKFVRLQREKYPEHKLQLRTGLYFLEGENASASEAIDSANYARLQVDPALQESSVCVFDTELRRKRLAENSITEDFDLAMARKEFCVYVQPRFSLKDFSLTGAEAMVRWQREDGNLLYPNDFLNLFEKNGRIIELDFFVFEEMNAFLAKCRRMGRTQIPVSVNASTLHARRSDTVKKYTEILEKYETDPALLEIEFTESDTISYYAGVKEMLKGLQNIHMTTALDDFGRGFSRLNMVIDVPINTVKLDRSFICVCETSEKGVYFLRQMVEVVKGLGYRVVCEGVETEKQVQMLREIGCDEAQGYWFARPMPLEEFERRVYEEGEFME